MKVTNTVLGVLRRRSERNINFPSGLRSRRKYDVAFRKNFYCNISIVIVQNFVFGVNKISRRKFLKTTR